MVDNLVTYRDSFWSELFDCFAFKPSFQHLKILVSNKRLFLDLEETLIGDLIIKAGVLYCLLHHFPASKQ